jgi:hypothetical protein
VDQPDRIVPTDIWDVRQSGKMVPADLRPLNQSDSIAPTDIWDVRNLVRWFLQTCGNMETYRIGK